MKSRFTETPERRLIIYKTIRHYLYEIEDGSLIFLSDLFYNQGTNVKYLEEFEIFSDEERSDTFNVFLQSLRSKGNLETQKIIVEFCIEMLKDKIKNMSIKKMEKIN